MFNSIIDGTITTANYFVIIATGLILGFLISLVSKYKSESSKSFFITTTILPVSISLIIMMVNGSIGTGIAVAGAFSLIRFRSEPGTAKEISIILIDMVIGIMLGMGYVLSSVIFAVILMGVLFIISNTKIFDKVKVSDNMVLKITVPETLDFERELEEVFSKHLNKYQLIKTKTALMGSLFNLTYEVTLKDSNKQKALLDDIRTKNSNLEVSLEKYIQKEKEL